MSGHSWVKHEREGWTVCTVCGLVRNYDRPDSQCRGTAKIALRSEQAVKPPCDLECGTCRYQLDPTHCADVVSGEQGPSAGELEIVRLRRERIEQESVSLEMGGEIARLRRELGEAKAERERLRSELDLERGQKKSDLLQDLAAARVALRNLVESVEATKCCDTIVLRDIEAARAVLGGQS